MNTCSTSFCRLTTSKHVRSVYCALCTLYCFYERMKIRCKFDISIVIYTVNRFPVFRIFSIRCRNLDSSTNKNEAPRFRVTCWNERFNRRADLSSSEITRLETSASRQIDDGILLFRFDFWADFLSSAILVSTVACAVETMIDVSAMSRVGYTWTTSQKLSSSSTSLLSAVEGTVYNTSTPSMSISCARRTPIKEKTSHKPHCVTVTRLIRTLVSKIVDDGCLRTDNYRTPRWQRHISFRV